MRRTAALLLGAGLNLCLSFAPLFLFSHESHWDRPEYVVLAIGLTLLLFADAGERTSTSARGSTPADHRALRLARVTGLVILAFVWSALWERGIATSFVTVWQVACGGALIALGAVLRAMAVRQLGEQFVTEVTPDPGSRLVRTGIYATMRHPSETGLLLALAGIALVLGSRWATLGAIPIFTALTWMRLRLEEEALRAKFGPSYGDYCREVGAIWPR